MTKFTRFHMAMSVDVDRHTDAYLRKHAIHGLTVDGEQVTVGQLRIACHNARLEGLRVLPPCDNTEPDGSCAGHATPEDGS